MSEANIRQWKILESLPRQPRKLFVKEIDYQICMSSGFENNAEVYNSFFILLFGFV